MRALWDHYPDLPYKAVVPWPSVVREGHQDWIASVDLLESWLETRVGPHWSEWVWSMWSLHNPYMCGVGFKQQRNCTLFLLQFSY